VLNGKQEINKSCLAYCSAAQTSLTAGRSDSSHLAKQYYVSLEDPRANEERVESHMI